LGIFGGFVDFVKFLRYLNLSARNVVFGPKKGWTLKGGIRAYKIAKSELAATISYCYKSWYIVKF
jgi:hypothetical protein